jgi:small-conductance mechanosensitive channel
MTERQAFISYFVGVLVVAVALMVGMKLLGADSETTAAVVVLSASAAGLGVGFIGVHYH